ncbi:hypothetical protein [Ureibacillus sp. FSL K6-0165]|uniref:hypothetical protein n=1 Tax=Ureibacillus sp. FSL K6-0165 TaxID=2954606 RepID=UPI0030F8E160
MSNLDIKLFVEKLKKQYTDTSKVITFKKYKHTFEIEGITIAATFGSTMGLNEFEGENLIIVGTPHFPPSKYLLTALTLNLITLENSNDVQMQLILL